MCFLCCLCSTLGVAIGREPSLRLFQPRGLGGNPAPTAAGARCPLGGSRKNGSHVSSPPEILALWSTQRKNWKRAPVRWSEAERVCVGDCLSGKKKRRWRLLAGTKQRGNIQMAPAGGKRERKRERRWGGGGGRPLARARQRKSQKRCPPAPGVLR